MPRYIDLEELAKRINENIKPENLEEKALIEWCKDECIRQGYAIPTSDVVPRAEIMRLVGEYYDKCDECRSKIADTVRAEVAREIFEEINAIKKEYARGNIDGKELYIHLYRLEKKYTEEQKQ